MKVLLVHGYSEAYREQGRLQSWLARLRAAGYSIGDFCVGMNVRGMRLSFDDLDLLWAGGDATLLRTYERLARTSEEYDVLINFGGVNLHPEFLEMLNVITILRFNDDPESSEAVSRPVAPYHDICAIGNVAAIELYKTWGVKHVYWVPMGFWEDEYNPTLTEAEIATGHRSQDVTLLCERINAYRRRAVDRYSVAFPQGVFRGDGWPGGFLPEDERVPLLQRTKIGLNMHNSTGPINTRTYNLPANGVLQICDNRRHLQQVYELGNEVVGYDTVDEAIELTQYYLAHDEERREIAAAGFRRAIREYNERACFERLLGTVSSFRAAETKRVGPTALLLLEQYGTRPAQKPSRASSRLTWLRNNIRRLLIGSARRVALFVSTVRLEAMRLLNSHAK